MMTLPSHLVLLRLHDSHLTGHTYDLKFDMSAETPGAGKVVQWFTCQQKQTRGSWIIHCFLHSTYLNTPTPLHTHRHTHTVSHMANFKPSDEFTHLWLVFSQPWGVIVPIRSLLLLSIWNPTTLSFNLTSIIFWDCPFPLWCLESL